MSTLKDNTTGGQRYNKYLIVRLPIGNVRVSLPDTKNDSALAKRLQSKANIIEKKAKEFPNEKDWFAELYIALGQEHKLPNYNVKVPTIKQAFEEHLIYKKLYKIVKKDKTISTYNYSCDFLMSVVGNIPVDKISALHKPMIERMVRKYGWADNTINMRTRNIMVILRWSKEQGYIDRLPFKLEQINVPKKTKIWIQPEVFREIIAHMPKEYRCWVIIAYHTGLRLRELGIYPDDKQFGGLFHTLHRVDNTWQLDVRGKNGKRCKIALPDWLKDTYDLMVSQRYHPCTISKHFKKACRKAGYPHHYFHNTRKSFGSNLVQANEDMYLISELLRHNDLKTTSTYVKDADLGWGKQVEYVNKQS